VAQTQKTSKESPKGTSDAQTDMTTAGHNRSQHAFAGIFAIESSTEEFRSNTNRIVYVSRVFHMSTQVFTLDFKIVHISVGFPVVSIVRIVVM